MAASLTWRPRMLTPAAAAQTKEEIAHSVKEELTKSMSSFGFMIIQTLVTDIEPDMKVRAAMNEINAAQRMRCAHGVCCVIVPPRCIATPGPKQTAEHGAGRSMWTCDPMALAA